MDTDSFRYKHPWIAHVLFWVAYTGFKVYHEFVWTVQQYEELSRNEILRSSIIAQVCILLPKVLFTYSALYVLIRLNKSAWQRFLIIISLLVATILIYRLVVFYMALPWAYAMLSSNQDLLSLERISSAVIDILLVAGIATALTLLRRERMLREQAKQLQMEKITAELKFLKQQIHPHFLFNTLNNLYALARKKSENAAEAIMYLSKLMRYMLYESANASVFLEKEIEMIQNYLALERLRFGDRLTLKTSFDWELNDVEIAPLLLLTLVENAFKHGAAESRGAAWIDISMIVRNHQLTFTVENSIPEESAETAGGVGLANLQRQLELTYPRHELRTSQAENKFIASLNLPLDDIRQS